MCCSFVTGNQNSEMIVLRWVALLTWSCITTMNDAGSPSMNVIRFRWRQTALFISALVALVLYNEWLIYYFVLLQCQWPALNVETNDFTFDDDSSSNSELRVMALADTHLLGAREGHWFDKLRRYLMSCCFLMIVLLCIHKGNCIEEEQYCSCVSCSVMLMKY